VWENTTTTTYEWLAGWAAPPVWWREKLAAVGSIRKRERGVLMC